MSITPPNEHPKKSFCDYTREDDPYAKVKTIVLFSFVTLGIASVLATTEGYHQARRITNSCSAIFTTTAVAAVVSLLFMNALYLNQRIRRANIVRDVEPISASIIPASSLQKGSRGPVADYLRRAQMTESFIENCGRRMSDIRTLHGSCVRLKNAQATTLVSEAFQCTERTLRKAREILTQYQRLARGEISENPQMVNNRIREEREISQMRQLGSQKYREAYDLVKRLLPAKTHAPQVDRAISARASNSTNYCFYVPPSSHATRSQAATQARAPQLTRATTIQAFVAPRAPERRAPPAIQARVAPPAIATRIQAATQARAPQRSPETRVQRVAQAFSAPRAPERRAPPAIQPRVAPPAIATRSQAATQARAPQLTRATTVQTRVAAPAPQARVQVATQARVAPQPVEANVSESSRETLMVAALGLLRLSESSSGVSQ